MVKFPEASKRKFSNVFVCRKCKTKRRADVRAVLLGKIVCRRCGYPALRPKRKK
jgi:ribosomal protein L40E